MASTFPFRKFIILHRNLCSRMLLFDSILGVLGSVFLLVPLDEFVLSLNNLTLLVLVIFSAVLYQIHIFRTYAGQATFYFNLPVKKYPLLLILTMDAVIPLLITLSITAITLVFSQILPLIQISTQIMIVERAYYTVLVLFILKTIALPVLVLYKRHIALILLFLFLLIFVYGIVSIIAEMLHMSKPVFGGIFLAGVEGICIRILFSAKIS